MIHDAVEISLLDHADPASPVLSLVGPQLQHLEPELMFLPLVDNQAVGQQGFYHEIHVGLEVGAALLSQRKRHVEHHIAGALVPQLEF